MIPVQNIYFMLSYAFRVLREQGYRNLAAEDFHNAAELCAAILAQGISTQLKRGIEKEYISQTDILTVPRGKIEVSGTSKLMAQRKKQLVCSFDEFSANSYMNRIIKSTVYLLLRSDISKSRKKELRKLMVYFNEVELIDIHTINWNLHYNRNNKTYQMLISICYLVVHGMLQTRNDGSLRLMDLDEPQMSWLYEKFIFEYYKQEFPMLSVSAPHIKWQLDNDFSEMLPVMKTDIVLLYREKYLIIDAKYYANSLQFRYDKYTIRSGHLYQIFAYVKNKEIELSNRPHEVSGMLLYAKTDEETFPNHTYLMSGNKISVQTLDLNCHHTEIARQLNEIVHDHFGCLN